MRLGGSEIIYLRTMGRVFESARAALRERRYMASSNGSRSSAGPVRPELVPRGNHAPSQIEGRPLPSPDDDTTAMRFSFEAPGGHFTGVLVDVQRGRVMASALVIGAHVNPHDVLALRAKLRASMRR